jgi:hypothetical protein
MKKIVVLFILTVFIAVGLTYAGDSYLEDTKKDQTKVTKKKVKKGDRIVYIKENGKKFHKKNCKLVKEGKIGIKLSEALKRGLTPCAVCIKPKAKKKEKKEEPKKEPKK